MVYIYKISSKRSFILNLKSRALCSFLLPQAPNPKFPFLHCNLKSHLSPWEWLFLSKEGTYKIDQHLLSHWHCSLCAHLAYAGYWDI